MSDRRDALVFLDDMLLAISRIEKYVGAMSLGDQSLPSASAADVPAPTLLEDDRMDAL